MLMPSERSLSLADVIDLELQVAADRDADVAALRRRDAQIATRLAARGIDPRQPSGQQLFVAWLDELRAADGISAEGSTGRRIQQLLAGLGLLLALVGLALGLSAVAAWLLSASGKPINTIFFLATVIGLQLPLLLLWVIAFFPTAWLSRVPGAETIYWLWGVVAQLPPRIVGWIVAKISPDTGRLLGQLKGQYDRWSWIYGPLRLWLLVRLTQIFALAFNVGLVAGFVLLSYGSDPAFGWKSTLLTEEQMHSATRIVAIPWRWMPVDWAAVPSSSDVIATRDWTQLETHDRGAGDAWSRWWPFLFAGLVCYGLLPRLVTLLIAHAQVRRTLRAIRLDHSEFDRLAERLARPQIETQATVPEADNGCLRQVERRPRNAETLLASSGPVATLAWAGVQLPPEEIAGLVTARLGGKVEGVLSVGRLDPSHDAQAIAQTASNMGGDASGRVALVVEAWEPPVADYLDFVTSLRRALGRNRPICVLLYDRDAAGRATVARESAAKIWQDRLGQLGDPWLRVDSLVATGEGGA
ncbi:MAG: DUF2868 domain-containing protein [Planctomycetes bacterium]|nr:DUF2868 domain-containing protein [Planctomycetota bacterium]